MKHGILCVIFLGYLTCGYVGAQTNVSDGVDLSPRNATALASTNSMEVLDSSRALERGDIVSYRVVEDKTPPINLRVSDSGEMEVPMLGRVRAAGKTPKQLAYEIKRLLERQYYHKATVIIGLESASTLPRGRVYISGAIGRQGPLDLPADERLTVSKAILLSGGFGDFADKRRVRVIRKDENGVPKRHTVDVKEVLERGRLEKDMYLQDGDFIVVPERGINF